MNPAKKARKTRADERNADTAIRGCGHRHNTNGYERCLQVTKEN